MQVVKGRDQLGMSRSEHTVTKYVAAHIADTNDGEIITVLDVHTAHTEVTFDRFPAAACGDTHGFMVIANRAT